MIGQQISNVANVLGILSAILSIIYFFKTKSYYNKVAGNNNLGKLSSLDKYLLDIRNLYENINRIHNTVNTRGTVLQDVINKYLEIESILNEIRAILPTKYEGIINSINEAVAQIKHINLNDLFLSKNKYFDELDTHITNIEEGIKLEKEKINGF